MISGVWMLVGDRDACACSRLSIAAERTEGRRTRAAAGADQFLTLQENWRQGRFRELNPDLTHPERRPATMFGPRFLSSAGFVD